MPRRLLLPAAVCAIAVFAAAVVTAGGKSQRTRTLRFDEKTTLFKIVDNPPADTGTNPESGDTVLFEADLMRGTKKVGTDRGFCMVVDPPKLPPEKKNVAVHWATGGEITTQKP